MAAVLVFKVALLTLKTAAKPLAKQFEKLVMNHPVMRQKVIAMAQVSRRACRRLPSSSAWQPGEPELHPPSHTSRQRRSLHHSTRRQWPPTHPTPTLEPHAAHTPPPTPFSPLPPCPALQRLHRVDVGISRGAEGKGGRVFVADMVEDKAVELASKVVSEGFLYSVSE